MSAPTALAKPPRVLNAAEKQEVQYCIPIWLRDEQVKLAIQRVAKRIQPHDKRPERIAIVCFGPSLEHTWETIRDFAFIITCSGSHKFLLARDIVPTWHVEVDPRPHKVELLGPPHPNVQYLPASTCHPKYFDHLEGFHIALWHVFDGSAEAQRVLPRGEWALTGGCNVGLRAMTIARFFGFTDQHIFGMDGCEGAHVGRKHAAPHPLQDGSGHSVTTYNGVEYRTTPSLLESARQTFHELNQMHDVTATFYGEGLVQAMAKDYARVPKATDVDQVIGIAKPELISATYRELNRQLHEGNLAYGVGGGRHAKTVLTLKEQTKASSVLDYGCGKGYLAKELPFPIWEYDPAVPGKEESPRPADLVICTDVLEHIEPDRLVYVLDDLRRVIQKVGYFVIHTGPAVKFLADGRNAHLIQEGRAWWEQRIRKFFTIGQVLERSPELHVVVAPKAKAKDVAA